MFLGEGGSGKIDGKKDLFSLTFLSDLMKQLQYGCQQKLVNDFKMIYFVSAPLPVLFNMYTDKDSNLISDF